MPPQAALQPPPAWSSADGLSLSRSRSRSIFLDYARVPLPTITRPCLPTARSWDPSFEALSSVARCSKPYVIWRPCHAASEKASASFRMGLLSLTSRGGYSSTRPGDPSLMAACRSHYLGFIATWRAWAEELILESSTSSGLLMTSSSQLVSGLTCTNRSHIFLCRCCVSRCFAGYSRSPH